MAASTPASPARSLKNTQHYTLKYYIYEQICSPLELRTTVSKYIKHFCHFYAKENMVLALCILHFVREKGLFTKTENFEQRKKTITPNQSVSKTIQCCVKMAGIESSSIRGDEVNKK